MRKQVGLTTLKLLATPLQRVIFVHGAKNPFALNAVILVSKKIVRPCSGKITVDVGVGEVVMIVADSAKENQEAVAGLVTSVVVMSQLNVGVAIVLVGAMHGGDQA